MPFSTPRFFKRRDTIDCVSPYGLDDIKAQACKNKLRKRAPFRYAERNIATLDLGETMGNKFSSIDSISRPQRPPRPSITELPNLPSLPIYKAFTAARHPATHLDEEKPPIPEKSASRRSSISIKGWQLADFRGRSSERTTAAAPRRFGSADTAKRERSVPRYDRASHLAESYRSLLPDMDSEPAPQTPRDHHSWSWDPREPRPQLHHLGNRSLSGAAQPSPARMPDIVHPWDSRPASMASSSSVTAVDQDAHSPVSPVFSDGGSTTPACLSTCRRWGLDSEYHPHGVSPDPWPHHEYSPPNRSSLPTRPRTSDDVGLQICAEMLTDELRRTLTQGKGLSKLQILLLIEAYEATLETCRKEILRPPVTRAAGADGVRRKHVREAVRILDHWLDSLYSMYDEEFGEVLF